MHLSLIGSLENVAPGAWDSLANGSSPFLRYHFLAALERTGCATASTGWTAQHLGVHEHPGGRLLGAVPLYLKQHSYGEFVFDWAWARAYSQAGIAYYPKLIVAVPFTPATGPRLLIAPEAPSEVRNLLLQGVRDYALELGASSMHWLFPTGEDLHYLERDGYLRRIGYQFHWRNQGYADFEQYLGAFSSQKRKKIRRERRQVREAGIKMEVLTGNDIEEEHWSIFYRFYRSTTAKHGASAYLTREFFLEIGRTMPDSVVLVLARQHRHYVAGALNLRGPDTLYGRYWGSLDQLHSLHFETCYYTAIEYCIANHIDRFEAGAQGEHKLSRGFLATPVYSAHWLRDKRFHESIGDFVAREARGVAHYLDELNEHSPYREDANEKAERISAR